MFSDLCTLFVLALLMIPATLFALMLKGKYGSRGEQIGYRVGKGLLRKLLSGK